METGTQRHMRSWEEANGRGWRRRDTEVDDERMSRSADEQTGGAGWRCPHARRIDPLLRSVAATFADKNLKIRAKSHLSKIATPTPFRRSTESIQGRDG
ncbi:unnamed protein product [Victoria cruziana]